MLFADNLLRLEERENAEHFMNKKQGDKGQHADPEEHGASRHDRHRDRAETARKKQRARDHIDRWESLPRNLPWDD